jgi:hypothetical protein
MSTFRVYAADSGYAIQVIAAGLKMFTNMHNTVKIELPILISILFFIDITEFYEVLFENCM